ncbi:GyrI-like domain-containing protein [Smaragdicoccus niigatensis]|uniref:GyrI-like domain-containing protein n=1 Tax=Smaragdicoccus niigatensis TaxID=359359 RepID=UPI000375690A|nr:GyrI-like domain-containing protein [Smaragdicoccus niigatensis]
MSTPVVNSVEFVELPGYLVAGYALPLSGRGVSPKDLDLINYTWDRYLDRARPGPRVAAYMAQGSGGAAVLGYACDTAEEADDGDLLTRIPAGRYAKVTVSGKPYDLTRTAWAEIRRAESEGLITRTFGVDIERFVSDTSIELYVSIA